MGTLAQAGQLAVAGQGQGQVNQYYGLADTSPTTVISASYVNLSSVYAIPAGEAYAAASYVLTCGGYGTWGSTQEALDILLYIGSAVTGCNPAVSSVALSASATFAWSLIAELTCADGISAWQATMQGALVQTNNAINPGTAADQGVPLAGGTTAAHTASVSSSIAVAVQARWGATTGAPTITNVRTRFSKVS